MNTNARTADVASFNRQRGGELERFGLSSPSRHAVSAFTLLWRLVLKRAVDVSGAVIGLIVLSPLFLIVGLTVKLDSEGPVIYSQTRVGRFGRLFKILKFRSMRVDAEADGPQWCTGKRDPRVTRMGMILRRTHIDELPQLWNVLMGDMSLVGPRPERPGFVKELDRRIDRYGERHLVKPGVTGLAQVHCRYDASLADVKRKLRFDLLYIRRMCLILDAKIIGWTFVVVMTGRGSERVSPRAPWWSFVPRSGGARFGEPASRVPIGGAAERRR